VVALFYYPRLFRRPPGIACAGVLVICLWVLLALFGHAPSLTSSLSPVEVEALPSHRVVLSRWSSVLWPPPTSHPASLWISPHRLIPEFTLDVDQRPNEISPVPSPTFITSRSPYAGEFFCAVSPGSTRLPWPSLCMKSSALSCSPFGANISTLQDLLYATGCDFALPPQEDNASAPPVTQKHWLPATWPPGSYHDRTPTG
jgi:hypothetical protein